MVPFATVRRVAPLTVALLVLALSWAAAETGSEAPCSLFQQRGRRPHGIMALTLRATPDSVRDDHPPVANEREVGHRTREFSDTAEVYAQVFELLTAEGDLGPLQARPNQRIALVWWRLGHSCQRVTPRPAVQRDVDELFLIARGVGTSVVDTSWFEVVYTDLRPETQWIQGMPTFDVGDASWTYSPRYRRPVNIPNTVRGDLTVPEYRDYFAYLPSAGASYEETVASQQRLLRWGDADPRRWRLFPAATSLCAAERAVRDMAQWHAHCAVTLSSQASGRLRTTDRRPPTTTMPRPAASTPERSRESQARSGTPSAFARLFASPR
jgi:hypothetical protein